MTRMTRVFSGIQPTGESTSATTSARCGTGSPTSTSTTRFYCVVDLHALTVPQDPAELRGDARSSWPRCSWPSASTPTSCTLFVQSHVHEHTELAWLHGVHRRLRRAAAA